MISSLLLFIVVSLQFQKLIMHKEAHHTSGPEIVFGGLQVLLVKKWKQDVSNITCHDRILTPVEKVIALL